MGSLVGGIADREKRHRIAALLGQMTLVCHLVPARDRGPSRKGLDPRWKNRNGGVYELRVGEDGWRVDRPQQPGMPTTVQPVIG